MTNSAECTTTTNGVTIIIGAAKDLEKSYGVHNVTDVFE